MPALLVLAVLLAVGAADVGTARPAAAAASVGAWNGAFTGAINARRSQHGLGTLGFSGDLAAVAQRHAIEMANAKRIWHNPGLTSQVGGWRTLGENVGNGPSVSWLMNALMASPTHRANILDRGYTQIGVGTAASSSGMIYVVQVFRQPYGAAPATSRHRQPTSAMHPATHPAGRPATAPRRLAPTPAARLAARITATKRLVPGATNADPLTRATIWSANLAHLAA
jgi:hypothetical protein